DWSSDVCSSDLIILQNQGMAWWLRSLHCRLTARRSWVRFPHGPLLLRGSGPPQTFSAPGPFCVVFACSPCVHKGFPPLKKNKTNRKNMQKNRTLFVGP